MSGEITSQPSAAGRVKVEKKPLLTLKLALKISLDSIVDTPRFTPRVDALFLLLKHQVRTKPTYNSGKEVSGEEAGVRKSIELRNIGLTQASLLSNVNNDFELVIRATKELDYLLESHFNAPSGKDVGLHEKIGAATSRGTASRLSHKHANRRLRHPLSSPHFPLP